MIKEKLNLLSKNKFKNLILKTQFMILLMVSLFTIPVFAAKYTIASGKDFNARIKYHLDNTKTSADTEYTILGFDFSYKFDGDLIDVSEDGDGSVLAYIKDHIIYVVSEEEIYLNEDASNMFDKFINIRKINLSEMNFSKTKKMNFMFSNCRLLTSINMDNDTMINLNEMQGMFYDCESLENADIFMLNTKNVRNMNSLFYNCFNLKNINVQKNAFKINNLSDYEYMYTNCLLLKTNFGTKVTNIKPSLYIKYTICGDDEKEGLLKDIDYEYDDYGKNDGKIDIDVRAKLVTSPYNTNIASNITNDFINNVKEKSIVKNETDSMFYDNKYDVSYDKNGNMKFSDSKLKETVDEIPILVEDTTQVDQIILKRKNDKASSSIVDPEHIASFSNIKGMLRPTFDYDRDIDIISTLSNTSISDYNIEESREVNKSAVDDLTVSEMIFAKYRYYILIGFVGLLIVGIGLLYNYLKNKHDEDSFKDK